MRIVLNGQDHQLAEGATVADLLADLDLSGKRVAVEVNKDIVRRAAHASHLLAADDQVEVVTLVGGG
ncbi:MAG: sulfur carrier protein ThiS [Planctomycetota bacterium]